MMDDNNKGDSVNRMGGVITAILSPTYWPDFLVGICCVLCAAWGRQAAVYKHIGMVCWCMASIWFLTLEFQDDQAHPYKQE